ncbi:YhdP family phospholipid transporter [Thiomicrorhabdus heinhorstiae]|uniref:YhdP central domain-containing protein n=1 Tax=Thiomicrorhabdus heinhorstiae TaxID=2748010 RepID=A0ABS0BXV5_9GAMM|nr:AsmA-like C-terminal region-containing protein [Thiomicrorhabdus heinhorstiae]MBF6058631.1 hypothetical protein [Thiomicrorhabdus heinhorstiae]
MLIKRVHQLLHLLFAVFLVYLLVTRAVITWVQVAPQQSVDFVEWLTDAEVKFKDVSIEQNLLGFRVDLDGAYFKNGSYEFQARKALVDVNLFAWLWPGWSIGSEIDIEEGYLSRGSGSKELTSEPSNVLGVQDFDVARLWQKVRISDFVVSNLIYPDLTLHINNLRSLKGAQLNLAAEFGVRYDKFLDYERFNLTASFTPSEWKGIGSGTLNINSFSPLRFERIEKLLPSSWSGVLPKGDMLLDAKVAVSQSQLSSVVLNVNGQSLNWSSSVNRVKNLPKSMGVELSWVLEHRNIHREFRDWRFQVSKMQLDNRFIETVSPLVLYFDDKSLLHFEAKAVDIDPFKNMIKSAISNPHIYAMFDQAAELSISDLHGLLNWQTLTLEDLSVKVDKLTVPKTEFPSLAVQNLQINKRPDGFEFTTNLPVWMVDTRIHSGAIRVDLPKRWSLVKDNTSWALEDFKFFVDKIPFGLSLRADDSFTQLEGELQVRVNNMSTLKQYLPYGFMSKPLTKWLSTALVDGKNIILKSSLKGDVSKFPFNDGGGDFSVTGEVDDVKLNFDSKWPMIEHAKVYLRYQPHTLNIRSESVDMGDGVLAKKVAVKIADLNKHDIAVNISGNVSATMDQVSGYLNRTPVKALTGLGSVLDGAKPLQGRADIRLDSIWIPVSGFDGVGEKVKGHVKLEQASLNFHSKLSLSSINGELDVSEKGVSADRLDFIVAADRLKGNGQVKVTTDSKSKQIMILGNGALKDASQQLFAGSLPWTANMTVPFSAEKASNLALNIPLSTAKSRFPAPFDERALSKSAIKLNVGFAEKTIDLQASVASLLAVKGDWRKGKGNYAPRAVYVSLGKGGISGTKLQPGLFVSGNIGRVDFDQWLQFIENSGLKNQYSDSGGQLQWRKSTLNIGELMVKNHPLKDLLLSWHEDKQQIILKVENEILASEVTFSGEEKLDVKVDRLDFVTADTRPELAEKSDQQCVKPVENTFPWKLLTFDGDDISIDGRKIDHLNFHIDKTNTGYKIPDLKGGFGNGAGAIQGDFVYDYSQNSSLLNMAITSKNVASVTKFLKLKSGFTGKSADVKLALNWLGELECFSTVRAKGGINFQLKDGVIEDVEPGFARLLGLLSVESLARRLQLDLKDVTNKGMVYDEIKGQAKLENGFLSLDDFALKAPSANVSMKGQIDIQKESFDLKADVTPAVGSSLPTIAALVGAANPLTALAVYTLMKVLPGINENLITYRFAITGPWMNPNIKQLEEKRSSIDFGNE